MQARIMRNPILCLFIMLVTTFQGRAQDQKDSTKRFVKFSGSLGFTNNGFSIIPSFSFNEPAALVALSWRWNRFSIDPDIRVTPTGKKGSMLLWFRYRMAEGKRFSIRLGVHPAVNWLPVNVNENGENNEYIRMRRFLAWEFAPSYRITRNWNTGLYYLQGHGLQPNGPQTTHFVNLNTTIDNIKIAKELRLKISPAFYFLKVDGSDGTYFTATGVISHTKYPFALHSTINQTITSNIPGNKNFMWNVGVSYNFLRELH